MAKKEVWFGTEQDMRWIPAPLANYVRGLVKFRAEDLYLNGGAFLRQSDAGHAEISLSWAVQSAESLAPAVTLLDQPGPLHYVDPIAMKNNVVPPYWAMPMLGLTDGPPLVPGVEPVKVSGTSTNGYPAVSARFVVSKATNTNLSIPVPPGHTLHLGVHGTGGTYRINGGTAVSPLTVANNTRTNLTFTGPGFANLQLASAATYNIAGIIAQILPTGKTPKAGGFLPGQGTTGLMLKDDYSLTNYSSELPNAQQGLAATLVEVGAWLQ